MVVLELFAVVVVFRKSFLFCNTLTKQYATVMFGINLDTFIETIALLDETWGRYPKPKRKEPFLEPFFSIFLVLERAWPQSPTACNPCAKGILNERGWPSALWIICSLMKISPKKSVQAKGHLLLSPPMRGSAGELLVFFTSPIRWWSWFATQRLYGHGVHRVPRRRFDCVCWSGTMLKMEVNKREK